MAQVTGKTAAKEGGDWECLHIRKAANGFTITKDLPMKDGKYQESPPAYLATEPGEVLDYVEHCVGTKETAAHEAREEKPGKKSASGKY